MFIFPCISSASKNIRSSGLAGLLPLKNQTHKRIHNPVKHLRWNSLRKQSLTAFTKHSILVVRNSSEYIYETDFGSATINVVFLQLFSSFDNVLREKVCPK